MADVVVRRRGAATALRRGDVHWVRFDPGEGVEIRNTRPAIVVSNDAANRHLSSVTVVPLSSNLKRVSPSQVLVELRGQSSKAMAEQIRTVDRSRLVGRRIGVLSGIAMTDLERVMRIHLAL